MRRVACDDFEEEIVRSPVPVIVLFTNEWCGSAFIVKGAMEEIEKTHRGKFDFIEVNEDECQEIVGRYGIVRIPQILIFYEAEIVNHITGVPSRKTMEDSIHSVLVS